MDEEVDVGLEQGYEWTRGLWSTQISARLSFEVRKVGREGFADPQ